MTETVAPRRRLEKLIDVLIILTILVMPAQVGFNTKRDLTRAAEALHLVAAPAPADAPKPPAEKPAPAAFQNIEAVQRFLDRVPAAHFTLADILVWGLLALWVLKLIVYRELRATRFWPLSLLALTVWYGLSVVQAWKPVGVTVDMNEAVKEMVQLAEYLIAGYLLFANSANRYGPFRNMTLAFGAATTAVVAIALLQYFNTPEANLPVAGFLTASADPMSVKALFSDRNVLGAFLAIALPFLWGVVLCEKNWLVRSWFTLVVLGGFVVVLSGGAMAALLLAVLSISFVRSPKVFVPVLVIILVCALYVWPKLPRNNSAVMLSSVLLYKPVEQGQGWPWQQRYVEWQPALLAMSHSPVFGVGAGNYQNHINQFYREIDKPGGKNYMEPNAINGYAILGVTAGFPAIMALAWVVLDFRRRSVKAYELFENGLERGVALGLYGALTGFTVAMFFTNIFVRGVGLTFVLLLAMAALGGRPLTPPKRNGQGEEGK